MTEDGSGGQAGSGAQITQADIDRLKADYESKLEGLQEKARKWDEYESKGKSEAQKALDELAKEKASRTRAEAELSALKLEKTKNAVGAKFKLPQYMWALLQGSDEKALEEHAKTLAKEMGVKPGVGGHVPPGGAQTAEQQEHEEMNAALRAMAGVGGR